MSYQNYDLTIPQLVSYPRTGSHWVRCILEQYLGKYCLPTSFYNNSDECWGCHLHDRAVGQGDEGAVRDFDKVIYLYRNPVDVVYSLLKYERWTTQEKINEIINEYKVHLTRWLYHNDDIKQIIYVTYEEVKNSPQSTFKKIILFLGEKWNEDKLMSIYNNTTHQDIAQIVRERDPQVISKDHINGEYINNKQQFMILHKEYIDNQFKELWK